MKIITETSLYDFEAWSGAKSTLANLDSGQCAQLESILEDEYPDGMEEGQLNDILWFERDWIAEMLGYEDWEDLTNEDEEDEEE